MTQINHFSTAKEMITGQCPNFEELLAWVHHKTNEHKPRLKSSKVLSIIDFDADVHFKVAPEPFKGEILYLEDAHPEILTRVVFVNSSVREDNLWTYSTAWVYANNRIVYDTRKHTGKGLSILPMNNRTINYHKRLINDARLALGDFFTLDNLLVTLAHGITKDHDYYPFNIADYTYKGEPTVKPTVEVEDVPKTLINYVCKLPIVHLPSRVSLVLKKVAAALNVTPAPTTPHARLVFVYQFDIETVTQTLLTLTTPTVIIKPDNEADDGVLSIWLPLDIPRVSCCGLVLNITPDKKNGFVTYVYPNGFTITDTKLFDLAPFTNLDDGTLITRVTYKRTLNRQVDIIKEISDKYHDVKNTFCIWHANSGQNNQLNPFAYGTGLKMYSYNHSDLAGVSVEDIDLHTHRSTDESTINIRRKPSESSVKLKAVTSSTTTSINHITEIRNMLKDLTGDMKTVLERLPEKHKTKTMNIAVANSNHEHSDYRVGTVLIKDDNLATLKNELQSLRNRHETYLNEVALKNHEFTHELIALTNRFDKL